VDSRSAVFAKAQLLWTPAHNWEARLIVTGERARDGDYALTDLKGARANPFHVSRDFEGYTHRDVVAPTLVLRRTGSTIDVTSTTGLVSWTTTDETDLDYSPLPLITRFNDERDVQFTQEIRLASAKNAPIGLSDAVTFDWQAGGTVFTQSYDQDAVNTYAPFIISQFLAFPVREQSPRAALDDVGIAFYGRGTFVVNRRVEATIGLRGDVENKQAALETFFTPAFALGSTVREEKSFSDLSPQLTLAYHVVPDEQMIYATASRGFKAGGFNPIAMPGNESFGEEHSWSYEGGMKTLLFDGRLSVNASAFYLRWTDLQVNVPHPFAPSRFFIANAAGAASKGAELDVNTRLFAGCDFFGGVGYTNAKFDPDSQSNGVAVGRNRISNTPQYTADFGGQYAVPVSSRASVYARAEVAVRGHYFYDDANTEGQGAHAQTTFRGGIRGGRLLVEGWVRNAFDTRYVPIAFAYPGLAPSGFVGESGAPRTFGLRAGVTF
jgi:iron complex outermembrane receptor protein